MTSYNNIYLNYPALEATRSELKNKINEINECYNSIKNRIKELSGVNDTWHCDEQGKYYSVLELIVGRYEKNIKKLNEIYDFLSKIIELYSDEDEGFGKQLDQNSDNLDM